MDRGLASGHGFRRAARSVLAIACCLVGASPGLAANFTSADWQELRHAKLGFRISVPADVFQADEARRSEAGHIFVSGDGRAKLLVGAFANDEDLGLEEYRQFLLGESYRGAAIDYAPVRKRWFVLSGTRDDEIFYERVSFTCGGAMINSWAMLYPAAERGFYDPVLEAIAKRYKPGTQQRGGCD